MGGWCSTISTGVTRREPKKPMQELIIYEMHVRGFTKHASSGVCSIRERLQGIREKIPYLKAAWHHGS